MKVVPLEAATLTVLELAEMAKDGLVVLSRDGQPLVVVKDVSGSDWESVSLANNPRFLALIEESRRSYRDEGGISQDDLRQELGLKPKTYRRLWAPREVPVADVVLRTYRRRWPNFVFQDMGEDGVHSADDRALWLDRTDSLEFFVYRDRTAARWESEENTPDDPNSMLYFIVSEYEGSAASLREVTLVCDEFTDEIRELIEELEGKFQYLASGRSSLQEAA